METWHKVRCLECSVPNWLYDGDLMDQTRSDIEGFQCWNCKKSFSLFENEFSETDETQEEGLEWPR